MVRGKDLLYIDNYFISITISRYAIMVDHTYREEYTEEDIQKQEQATKKYDVKPGTHINY